MTTVYHGTPLTPRAALVAVGAGRAMCVSFYRPDDAEVVEAISQHLRPGNSRGCGYRFGRLERNKNIQRVRRPQTNNQAVAGERVHVR